MVMFDLELDEFVLLFKEYSDMSESGMKALYQYLNDAGNDSIFLHCIEYLSIKFTEYKSLKDYQAEQIEYQTYEQIRMDNHVITHKHGVVIGKV